jgi:hypothetical protein
MGQNSEVRMLNREAGFALNAQLITAVSQLLNAGSPT